MRTIHRTTLVLVGALAALGAGGAAPASASSPAASCIGQFFSSHAGLVPATGGEESVGGFISPTAQDLGSEFGAAISGSRVLPRSDCGL